MIIPFGTRVEFPFPIDRHLGRRQPTVVRADFADDASANHNTDAEEVTPTASAVSDVVFRFPDEKIRECRVAEVAGPVCEVHPGLDLALPIGSPSYHIADPIRRTGPIHRD
jgi:hypothetical protein